MAVEVALFGYAYERNRISRWHQSLMKTNSTKSATPEFHAATHYMLASGDTTPLGTFDLLLKSMVVSESNICPAGSHFCAVCDSPESVGLMGCWFASTV